MQAETQEATIAMLAREARRRAGGARLWFLRPASGRGRWALLAGVVAAALVALIFVLLTAVMHGIGQAWPVLSTGAAASSLAFFALSLGFLAGIARLVFPAATRDLEELRAEAACPAETLDAMAAGLQRLPAGESLRACLPALAIGTVHILLLEPASEEQGVRLAVYLNTLLLWLAMFQIAIPLLHNARLFSLLGACTRVDLYNTRRLAPFGHTAIRPCLFIIALQCAYAVLILPEGATVSPTLLMGLTASMGLVAGLFLLPLGGIRRRIASRRDAAVRRLDDHLAASFTAQPPHGPVTDGATLAQTEALLALRARLAGVSSWPLGFEGLRRLLFYLILVPLAWVGAALVEMMLDGRL